MFQMDLFGGEPVAVRAPRRRRAVEHDSRTEPMELLPPPPHYDVPDQPLAGLAAAQGRIEQREPTLHNALAAFDYHRHAGEPRTAFVGSKRDPEAGVVRLFLPSPQVTDAARASIDMVAVELRRRGLIVQERAILHDTYHMVELRADREVPANLPDGWHMIEDGYDAFQLVPPPGFEYAPGEWPPRFYWTADEKTRTRAVAKREAERICQRIVEGTWTTDITVATNHHVNRVMYEAWLEQWKAQGWAGRIHDRHLVEHLAETGVLEQFPDELRPPAEAVSKALAAKSKRPGRRKDNLEDGD